MAVTRREFLAHGIRLAALGVVAPAFLVKAAYASRGYGPTQPIDPDDPDAGMSGVGCGGDTILLVIQLSGGNDGLNTVVPYRDATYYTLRPNLAIPREQALPITDQMGLHPALRQVKSLYDQGHVAVLESVGYPNPNRSHFRAMDIWQTARPDVNEPTGWLGRYLAGDDCEDDAPLRAVNIGPRLPRTLWTESTIVPSIANIETYQFRTDGRFAADRQAQMDAIHHICTASHAPGADEFVRLAALEALDSSDLLQRVVGRYEEKIRYPDNPFAEGLKLIAQVIAAEVGTRVFYISLGGFDTHAQQARDHTRLLQSLDEGLGAFFADMDRLGKADRVLAVTFSEFGRRVAENASGGTDHGTALPMLLVGGRVRGGFYGAPPDLAALRDGDIAHQTDFRAVYAGLLRSWLGVDPAGIIEGSWPALDFVQPARSLARARGG
jgi:uncharacterized protein (DUF1501 family)